MPVRITVVVPFYNTSDYLPECLDSLRRQEKRGFSLEVMLVDDGSTDDSAEVVSAYLDEHPDDEWHLIRKVHSGLSATRNAGLKEASGDYIYFLDSDDSLETDALLRCLEVATDSQADLVIGRAVNVSDGEPAELHYTDALVRNPVMGATIDKNPELVDIISAWPKLYKAELVASIRFPEGIIHEDNYYSLLVYDRARCISIAPDSIYKRRIRNDPDNPSIMQTLGMDTYIDFLRGYGLLLPNISAKNKKLMVNLTARNLISYVRNKLKKEDRRSAYTAAIRMMLGSWAGDIRNSPAYGKAVAQMLVTAITGKY